jgi:serine/threonine protein kinase
LENRGNDISFNRNDTVIDIEKPETLPFLSESGRINIQYKLEEGEQTFSVLAFFIHLVLPHLGSLTSTTIKILSCTNRSFNYYIYRVRKLHLQYQEMIKCKDKKLLFRSVKYACSFGDFRRLKDLLSHTSDSLLKNPVDGTPATFYALHNGHNQLVRNILKKYPKSMSYQTNDGVTLLHIASLFGATSIMNLLIKSHPELIEKAISSTKETPVFLSIISQNQAPLSLLLQNGADITKTNYSGLNPEAIAKQYMIQLEFRQKCEIRDIKKYLDSLRPRSPKGKSSKSLDDFVVKKKLGEGAFGEVFLAVDKANGKEVALKQMLKSTIREKNKKDKVDNERKILQLAQQYKLKYMVHLHVSFQTEDMLYLAMDFCPGGDLGELLEVIAVLDENEAKCWFAEMICAVHYLHQLNCIHRDLKPENFFIDARGHIKLGDFGLSAAAKQSDYLSLNHDRLRDQNRLTVENFSNRFGQNTYQSLVGGTASRRRIAATPFAVTPRKYCQAYSVVGSPEFMSPEILALRESGKEMDEIRKSSEGYSFEVDWWSLGCVFYTCILGGPPFSGESPDEVFQSIINYEQMLPEVLGQYAENMSKECYSLLSGFLTDAGKRLGRDLPKLKAHKFFEGLNWDQLDQMPSGYVPTGSTDQ